MPAKSKAQARFFRSAAARGEVSERVADEFTKGVKTRNLPERLHKRHHAKTTRKRVRKR
jgi:hypothetical protein